MPSGASEAASESKLIHGSVIELVRYELGSMFTTLEGDLGEIFALIQEMQEAVFRAGAVRVSAVIKVDDRRDRSVRMEDKVRSVEEKL